MTSTPLDSEHPRYVLILAGGSGQRFWPLSRDSLPKQAIPLFEDRSLLQLTWDRVTRLVPPHRVLVMTNPRQAGVVAQQLPALPTQNLLVEPDQRDTAAAIALGAGLIAAWASGAVVAVLPADQVVLNDEAFVSNMAQAMTAAVALESLVTIGIQPTWPCPSYGYLELGPEVDAALYPGLRQVRQFREKPKPVEAVRMLQAGGFVWNAGMFVFTVPVLARELRQHAPHLADFLEQVAEVAHLDSALVAAFRALPKVSFDYAVMEKAERVLQQTAQFDWDDLGSWISYGRYLRKDAAGNQVGCSRFFAAASSRNIAVSRTGQTVALLGVEDVVVVATADAILVAQRDQLEQLRGLVGDLPADLR